MNPSSNRNQIGMAPWVKGLITVVIVCLVLILVSGIVIGIMSVKLLNEYQESLDPDRASQMLATMVEYEKFPKNRYKYISAMEYGKSLKWVIIKDKLKHYKFFIYRRIDDKELANSNDIYQGKSIQQLLAERVKKSAKSLDDRYQLTYKDVGPSGTIEIAGKEVPYNIGITKIDNQPVEQKLVAIVSPNNKLLFTLHTEADLDFYKPDKESGLDMEAVKLFFSHIKKFK